MAPRRARSDTSDKAVMPPNVSVRSSTTRRSSAFAGMPLVQDSQSERYGFLDPEAVRVQRSSGGGLARIPHVGNTSELRNESVAARQGLSTNARARMPAKRH